MAFSLALFKPISLVPAFPEAHGGEPAQFANVFTCIPTVGYIAALTVNVCILPLLLLIPQDTCRRSIFKTSILYGLFVYNFILAITLINGVYTPTGGTLVAFLVVLMITWLADRVRFCLLLRSYIPLFDMRSHFIRVSTVSSYGMVPVNQTKPLFIRNFDQRCRCSRCFYVHSSHYLECTYISRFTKVSLVAVTDFSLNGITSTVFVPSTRDSVPLHIIAPSVLSV
ncbi:ORF5 protein [Bat coronavirus]|uniref:ORF5 protein n=1 Tax=Bat coronavirus TaxID=1508220 RepID=UPI000A17B90A|nr:ORF5 protein [Bat coronavirus]ARJ34230.1 ORF5 protein [Bat coronavirus]